MNTAAIALKKIDLLAFIAGIDVQGASMGARASAEGDHTGVISFPSFGNWTNKPVAASRPSRDTGLRGL